MDMVGPNGGRRSRPVSATLAGMTSSAQRASAPTPIVGAVLVSGVLAALTAFLTFNTVTAKTPDPLIYGTWATLTALFAFSSFGAWRSWQAAQITGAFLGVVLTLGGLYVATVPNIAVRLLGYDTVGLIGLVIGALLASLLVVPKSSRDWFAYEH